MHGHFEEVITKLLGRFAVFGDAASRLSADDIETVLRELGHEMETIQQAIMSLGQDQLAKVLIAEKSPAGYLKKMLQTAIEERQSIKAQQPASEGDVDHEQATKYAEKCAQWFARWYNNNQDGLAWEPLVPIFPAAVVLNPKNLYMCFAMEYAFDHDPYFRGLPIEQAARTFLKQLDSWMDKYSKAFPDGPPV